MQTFRITGAQGDVLLVRVESLPKSSTECHPDGEAFVIAHSETGHNHVMLLDRGNTMEPNVRMYSGDNPLLAWIEVNRPTALEHQRSFDTHEPIVVAPGTYEVRRQREYTPEGFRQVQD